jgi:hypothetical protein
MLLKLEAVMIIITKKTVLCVVTQCSLLLGHLSDNLQKAPSISKLDLNLRKKLIKCYIWNIALCGAETLTLQKVDQKYLGSFETWYW